MAIKYSYDSKDDVPAELVDLYKEADGKWVLDVEGAPAGDGKDATALRESLRKEREDHKKTKDKLRPFTDLNLDAEDVASKLDRFEELEAAAEGKVDDAKINDMVERRIKSRMAPVERENRQLKDKVKDLEADNGELSGTITKGKVETALRSAATSAKLVTGAIEDAILIGGNIFEVTDDGKVVTRDGVGVTPGLEPAAWLADQKQSRAHWWPVSQGGGASGADGGGKGGSNPWTAEHWNMTEQGKVIRAQGREAAERMAKAAGSRIGATAPAKKSA